MKLQTIQIIKTVYVDLKKIADEKGFKLYHLLSDIVTEWIEKSKEGKNV